MPAETAIAPPAPNPQPAPAPTPPPAPNPGAPVAPQPKADVKPGDHLNDAFADLDALATPDPASAPEPKAPKTDVKPNPKAPEPAKLNTPAQPEKAATLRANYDKVKADYLALEKKHRELEERASKPQDDPEKKQLQAKLSDYEKRMEEREKKLAEMDEQLRYTNYERTNDYKENYEKPWITAYQTGQQKVSSLKIKLPDKVDPTTGDVIEQGQARQGTKEDFDALMRIADDDDAAEYANRVFGSKSPSVLYHRERVLEANQKRIAAIEEYRTKGAEREKVQSETSKKQREDFVNNWKKQNSEDIEKRPHLFKAEEGDEKGKTLLEKGFQTADRAFGGTENMAPEEAVRLMSAVRNKAAGFDFMVYKHAKAQALIAELQAKLKAFEGSEPQPGEGGGGAGGGDGKADSMDSVVATLDKLAK